MGAPAVPDITEETCKKGAVDFGLLMRDLVRSGVDRHTAAALVLTANKHCGWNLKGKDIEFILGLFGGSFRDLSPGDRLCVAGVDEIVRQLVFVKLTQPGIETADIKTAFFLLLEGCGIQLGKEKLHESLGLLGIPIPKDKE